MTRQECTITITNRKGLHARPVTEFVRLANQHESKIQVTKGELTVDGKSAMAMLTLAAETGTMLRITATGPDAPEAIDALAELIRSLPAREKIMDQELEAQQQSARQETGD